MNSIAKSLWMLVLCVACGSQSAIADAPTRVLIVDGQNNYHNWKAGTADMKRVLAQNKHLEVSVSTTPPKGAAAVAWDKFTPNFSNYNVVIINYWGDDWPDALYATLETYVRKGGGLVVVHSALAAFSARSSYQDMIGLAWRKDRDGIHMCFDNDGKCQKIPKGEGALVGHVKLQEFALDIKTH